MRYIAMRYIGNKTKLLPFIASALDRLELPKPARVLDAFAGTAAVGSFLKSRGATVVGCDLMTFSYVFQRAYVVAESYPQFTALCDDTGLRAARRRPDFAAHVDRRAAERAGAATADATPSRPLDEVLVYLDHYLDPLTAFISHHFAMRHVPETPVLARPSSVITALNSRRVRPIAPSARLAPTAPSTPRMYFTLDAARRIDAIRVQLHEWRASAAISDDEFYILLAALIEAADSVANTAGIYAAYIKSWQSNALREVRLRPPAIAARPGPNDHPHARCEAHQGDVSALAPTLGHFDLLYLDPPYNTRQYSAYYHIPELIARGWFDGLPVLRGKTGLLPGAQKSQWSTRAGCGAALDRLLSETDADHVVMSYNSEGIIPETEITRIFRAHGRRGSYRRITRTYQRYRSDRPSATRRYKSDSVREHLYCVRLRNSD
jgi:adenine-specific DNA-methyltransferase